MRQSANMGESVERRRSSSQKQAKTARAAGSGIHALDVSRELLWTGDMDGAIGFLETALENVCPRHSRRVDGPRAAKTELKVHEVGPVVEFLCMCLSKRGEWESVCRYADMVLEPDNDIPSNPEVRLDVRLRRGVALSHLAGPTEAEPRRAPHLPTLERAEKDLVEVCQHRPKDEAVRCGIKMVRFLRSQVAEDDSTDSALRGLARLRAMDP